jgi:replicative DNA helicase
MDLALIQSEAEKLKSDNYVIDDNSFQTPQSIKATLRRWIANKQIDIVFIDYLTLIKVNYGKMRNDLEIGALSQELREFAKETKLPIVMLSQLNRVVESRIDKKPFLSDLRESGSIEQDANLVMFIHRPAYYGINPYSSDYENMELTCNNISVDAEDIASIIIAKSRNGQTGTVPLQYIPKYHLFNDIEIRNQYKKVSNEIYPFK